MKKKKVWMHWDGLSTSGNPCFPFDLWDTPFKNLSEFELTEEEWKDWRKAFTAYMKWQDTFFLMAKKHLAQKETKV